MFQNEDKWNGFRPTKVKIKVISNRLILWEMAKDFSQSEKYDTR